jgi:hypothetical protein
MVSFRRPMPDRVGFLTHTPRLRVPKPPLRQLSLRRLIELAPKRVSYLIHIFKMQPSNTFEVKTWLLLGIEPLQLESSMGVVECRSTLCIQLFKQGPSMRGCSRYGGSRGCWGSSSTAVLGSFDTSRRTPPLVVHSGTLMIGNERLR